MQAWEDIGPGGQVLRRQWGPIGADPGRLARLSELSQTYYEHLPPEIVVQVREAVEAAGLVDRALAIAAERVGGLVGGLARGEASGVIAEVFADVDRSLVSDPAAFVAQMVTSTALEALEEYGARVENREGVADDLTREIAANGLATIALVIEVGAEEARHSLDDATLWRLTRARWDREWIGWTDGPAQNATELRAGHLARTTAEACLAPRNVRTIRAAALTVGAETPRNSRRRRAATPATRAMTPAMLPGFHGGEAIPDTGKHLANGVGWVPNDLTSHGAVRSFQKAGDGRWATGPDGYPYDQHAGKDWGLSYFLSPEDTPSTDEAAALVGGMNDETADVYMIASAQWLANHQRDPKGSLAYLAVDQVLEQRGTAKAKHGGYRSEDRARVAEHMRRIGAVWVEGNGIPGYERNPKGKGSRRVTRRLRGKLLIVSTVDTQETLEGEPRPVGYFYRLGDWARSLTGDEGAPQLAKMMQTVIALDWKHAKYPKRLGYFLTWRFRTCARERSYAQTLTVIKLLEGAGLEVPANNPQRFRELVEAGLADLKHAGVIGDWRYTAEPTLPKYKWLERWLTEWPLVITPPAELAAEYLRISTAHRASQPPKALPKTA